MADNNNPKVLLIGLDGATWDVINPLIELGVMPNMARLKMEGAWGILKSTIPPVTAPAWATFYTGKNPGKHGIIHFYDLKNVALEKIKKDEVAINNYSSIVAPTIYDYFANSNKTICSINMPMTYPPPNTNGNVISCWLAPSGDSDFTYPTSLREEITDYQIDLFLGRRLNFSGEDMNNIADPNSFFPDIIALLKKRANVGIRLLTEKDWDLFMICFTETDIVQHFYIKLLNNLNADTPEVKMFKEFYNILDNYIGKFIEQLDTNSSVIIMSDHGFDQPIHTKFNINTWLLKKGLFTLKDHDKNAISELISLNNYKKKLRKILHKRDPVLPAFERINWEKTQAFGFNLHNMFGGICLVEENLLTESDNNKVITMIIDGLNTIRSTNGEKVVKNIWKREELIQGEYEDIYPDLVFEMIDGYGAGNLPVEINENDIFSNKLGAFYEKYSYSEHDRNGILLATGNDINKNKTLPSASYLEDCLPTIFYMLDMPIPSDCDGKIMDLLFNHDFLSKNKPKFREPIEREKIIRNQPTQDNDEEIRRKLSGLGYL